MKSIALIILLIAVTLLVTGCASYPSAGTQPRAMQLGAFNPYCLLLCFSTSTATNAEHGTAQGGNSSQSGTLAIAPPTTP